MNQMNRNLLLWGVIVLAMAMLFNMFQQPQSGGQRVPYTDFLAQVESGQILSVTMQGNTLIGKTSDNTTIQTYAPPDSGLVQRLLEKKVVIKAEPPEGQPWYMALLVSWFPMLLFIGVWVFFMRQMQGGSGKAMSFGRSRARLLNQDGGARVEFFSLKMVDYVIPAYYIIACAEASSNLERFDGVKYGYRNMEAEGLHEMYKLSRAEGFGEEVKRRILLGSFVLSAGYYDAYYIKALKTKRLIKEEFDEAFKKYDCILAPAAPTTAPKLGTSLSDPLQMYLSDIYTVAVNLCGFPALSMPCGVDSKGLPIGVQFIGDLFNENKILNMATAYEKVREDFSCGKFSSKNNRDKEPVQNILKIKQEGEV